MFLRRDLRPEADYFAYPSIRQEKDMIVIAVLFPATILVLWPFIKSDKDSSAKDD